MSEDVRRRRLQHLARLRSEAAAIERELDAKPPRVPEVDDALQVEAYQLLAEHGSDLMSIHSAAGTYRFVSPNVEALFGHRPDALLGRSAYELFHPDDLERIAADHSGHEAGRQGRIRYRLRCADGSYRWVETRSRARAGEDGVEHIVAITTDVHEEELARQRAIRAEAGLVRAGVERTLARLAEGVAHEVNNALCAAMAEASLQASPELDASLLRIQRVCEALVELGQSEPEAPARRDLGAEVRAALLLVPESVRDVLQLELDVVPVEQPPRELRRLLHALLHLHLPDITPTPVRVRVTAVDGAAELTLDGPRPYPRMHADFRQVTADGPPMLDAPEHIAARLADELGLTLEVDRAEDALRTRVRFPGVADVRSRTLPRRVEPRDFRSRTRRSVAGLTPSGGDP